MSLPQRPERLRLALWATNIGRPLNGIGAWAAAVEERLAEAAALGASILVMPEYCAEQWLSFAPAGLGESEEIPWMAAQADAALAALRPLPARYGVALLAGTMPVAADRPVAGAPWLNRAWLLLPDGRAVAQDKLCLTPFEKDPASWNLSPGDSLQVVTWNGLRIVTLVCLDVELPALAARLAPLRPDLILVPSQTSRLAGYHRVFGCAKARAVELQAAVAVCGTIGAAAYGQGRGGYVSGCSLFLPCEERLGSHGRAAEVPPLADDGGAGPLLYAEVPLAAMDSLRAGAAEVWPGAWDAAPITLAEA